MTKYFAAACFERPDARQMQGPRGRHLSTWPEARGYSPAQKLGRPGPELCWGIFPLTQANWVRGRFNLATRPPNPPRHTHAPLHARIPLLASRSERQGHHSGLERAISPQLNPTPTRSFSSIPPPTERAAASSATMLLPKAYNWKTARASFPPPRAIWVFVARTRFLLALALVTGVILLYRSVSSSASEMQK